MDLIYRIYSTQIRPVLSARPEQRVKERESPQDAAGQTTVMAENASPFHFTPAAGYDSTNLMSGGGRFEFTPRKFWKLPFKSAIIKGEASPRMHNVVAALEGAYDSQVESGAWLAHAEWLINFVHYSLPTGAGDIRGGHLTAHFAGVTKPLFNGNVSLRFGGSLEGGNRQTEPGSLIVAPDTVSSAGFGSLKLYGAMDSRFSNHIVSASYGVELGSVDQPRALTGTNTLSMRGTSSGTRSAIITCSTWNRVSRSGVCTCRERFRCRRDFLAGTTRSF